MAQAISLYEALEHVPEHRCASGRRHPLPAVLTLAAVAMLSGAHGLNAIAQFGRDHGARFARALGFPKGKTPSSGTLHYVFRDLDAAAFEAAIQRWLAVGRTAQREPVAVDGKTLRGAHHGPRLPGVHLLAAYEHEAGRTLGQVEVDAETNEHRAALELLEIIPVEGRVITGDAMFCQRDLSDRVVKKGGTTSGRSRTTSRS